VYSMTAGLWSGNPAIPPYAELGAFAERVRAYLMSHQISPTQIFVEIGRPHVFRPGSGYINVSPPPQFGGSTSIHPAFCLLATLECRNDRRCITSVRADAKPARLSRAPIRAAQLGVNPGR